MELTNFYCPLVKGNCPHRFVQMGRERSDCTGCAFAIGWVMEQANEQLPKRELSYSFGAEAGPLAVSIVGRGEYTGLDALARVIEGETSWEWLTRSERN